MAVNLRSQGTATPAALHSPEHILSLDAGEAHRLFNDGKLTISGLLSRILTQIKDTNTNGPKLGAIVFLASEPQLMARAGDLQQELESGHSRGPLHGIPVVLKDCIATSPLLGMPTSAGSYALLNTTKVTRNAPIVERLLDAGAIIVGKSNLSEFCAFKGDGLIDGFSPVGGQTKSPYVYGEIVLDEGDLSPSSPGGSSTGSAVSVSAGFALIGIGTENDGSIVQPASR
ncbi:amidase signature domain-containing protein [Dichotomopilus funicola]|uniref:Amidase signature domain-containing protein n=1 Tax=Dichotomopilus funicola TaxID=1934379 RepID=A0AAN6ZNN2_9PEZI|nr:amidase signature domain-containing protein [Dichotomopilus funicola]